MKIIVELQTQPRNTLRLRGPGATVQQLTTPTQIQARAHQLIAEYTPSA